MKKTKKPFKEYLNDYDESLDQICIQLMDICSSKKDHHQQKIWMGPNPPNEILSDVQDKQLYKIIRHTNKITGQNGFRTFKRHFFWRKTHHDLLLKDSHHFSPKGIRLITQLLAEIIGKKWHRPLSK